jgi:hypothetical protein
MTQYGQFCPLARGLDVVVKYMGRKVKRFPVDSRV